MDLRSEEFYMAKVTLVNQADFAGTYGTENQPVTFASNEVSTTIIRGLTAVKTADQTYWVNGPLTYQVKITNNSGDTFTKGVLTDNLDTALVAFNTAYGVKIDNSPTSSFTYSSGALSVTLPDMEDGATITVSFQVTQVP